MWQTLLMLGPQRHPRRPVTGHRLCLGAIPRLRTVRVPGRPICWETYGETCGEPARTGRREDPCAVIGATAVLLIPPAPPSGPETLHLRRCGARCTARSQR